MVEQVACHKRRDIGNTFTISAYRLQIRSFSLDVLTGYRHARAFSGIVGCHYFAGDANKDAVR